MNKDKLKRVFDEVIVKNQRPSAHDSLLWLNIEGEAIGFNRERLTEKELLLLKELYPKFVHIPEPKTTEENEWNKWFLEERELAPNSASIRFIHFTLEQSIDDYDAFHDIWDSMSEEPSSIIWFSQKNGVVINTNEMDREENDYESLIDAMSSDFYADVTILIGSEVAEPKTEQFKWEQQCLEYIQGLNPKKRVFHIHEAYVYYLLSFIPSNERNRFMQSFFTEEVLHDFDLLNSISIYFESNLNISLAAKTMHMHRNSLQYRLDKFSDKTGIDLKQFSQAALVYSLLLLLPLKKH
ncbi:PucR family transcriptional regulator [Alkalihalobacillus sp. 1P02AB]|uniref:PucR family transcriptional regulator n=1 Tax=Alkalihalobacillus sp. 1P02AB TaxID=3132260 RepID=UPI0039A6B30F